MPHLAKPSLAPHALRNLTASWLSREILLVQAFAGAAIFAMTRVYLLKTVPVWNSPATLLEFAGCAMLLGGVLTSFGDMGKSGWSPAFIAAVIGILWGLILKLTAISPTLTAEQATQDQTWYEPTVKLLSAGRALAIRIGLNLAGLVLILAAMGGYGPTWLWPCLSLACFGSGEALGRLRFYKAYRRLGL